MQGSTIPFRPVEIQLDAAAFSVAPGGSAAIPFAVVNHTNSEDYFDITVQGIPTEWVLLDMPVIHLASGERREASLTIQAPGTSPLSAGVYPVLLRATSQSNRAEWGEASFDLRVGGYETTMQAETVPAGAIPPGPYAASDRVGVSLNTLQYSIAPGETLSIPVTLTNLGGIEDTFYLTVEGTPANWAPGPAPAVHLMPGESRVVELVLQTPVGPASPAGRHSFRLTVRSQAVPSEYAVIDATVTVAAVSRFASDLTPRHMDAGRTARLRIHNLSNIPDTYTVRWQGTQGELDFVSSYQDPVRVMPGETAVIDFAVSPRSPNWFGQPVTLPYSVTVRSAEGDSEDNHAEAVSRSLIPIWVLPLLAILCLTAFCGVGFLWNWNQNRLAGARATADAQLGLVNAQTATIDAATADAATASAGTATANAAAVAAAIAATSSAQTAVAAGLPPPTPTNTNTPQPATATPIPTFTPLTPTFTFTPHPPTPTLTFTPVPPTLAPIPPTLTFTPLPPTITLTPTVRATFTFTPAPVVITVTATATATAAAAVTVTPTQSSLPVTGQQLFLFVSNRGGSSGLYLFNSADGSTAPLPGGSAGFDPAWSPDGSRVAFTTNRDGNDEIYVMNADGSNPVNLTKNTADDRYPAWSPDGKQIAFTSNRDGNNEIYLMNADGSNPVNLTKSPANDSRPAWYAQKGLFSSTSRILFTTDRDGNNEIYAMNTDGSNPVNLTQNSADDNSPAVSSSGQVAFVTNRDGNNEIYEMNADGSKPTNLTKNPADDNSPAWSPDGKWIAFVTNRDGHQQIYLMAADGSQVTNVSRSTANDTQPAWH